PGAWSTAPHGCRPWTDTPPVRWPPAEREGATGRDQPDDEGGGRVHAVDRQTELRHRRGRAPAARGAEGLIAAARLPAPAAPGEPAASPRLRLLDRRPEGPTGHPRGHLPPRRRLRQHDPLPALGPDLPAGGGRRPGRGADLRALPAAHLPG